MRLLRVCGLLLAHPGITADQLAAEVGVHRRTIFRYVNKIREAGFSIDFDRELGGYYCTIGEGFWERQAELAGKP